MRSEPRTVRPVDDAERRRRFARRHGLAPEHRLPDVAGVVQAMTVLHATEPPTVHLAVAARCEAASVADVEQALHVDRTLVKQLAMRRTVFAFPPDLLPAAWGSAAARTHRAALQELLAAVAAGGLHPDPEVWWREVGDLLRAELHERGEVASAEVSSLHPRLAERITVGSGRWTNQVSVGPRALLVLGARGEVVRSGNRGHWRTARPAWSLTADVLPEVGPPLEEGEGYAELVRRWLHTFGPGTEDDLVWWLGSTRTAVRRALTAVDAVAVALDGGQVGWLLPDDVEPVVEEKAPWAALLPTLDPTLMGWKGRDFVIDPEDVPLVFDSAGNAVATAWWQGRVVGTWAQDDDARVRVVVHPRHEAEVGAVGRAALEAEAERLGAFLDGVVVASPYATRMRSGKALP